MCITQFMPGSDVTVVQGDTTAHMLCNSSQSSIPAASCLPEASIRPLMIDVFDTWRCNHHKRGRKSTIKRLLVFSL
jgi:hypothetical protein